jgi:hypothetical protein
MRQPTLPNRKPPEFLRCPICGVEFLRRTQGQQWCSSDCANPGKRQRGDGADALFREFKGLIEAEGAKGRK